MSSVNADLHELIPADLPDGREVVRAAKERAASIPVGRARYVEMHGARSDREYKERCREDGTITTYINLGYKTWAETREALEEIVDAGKRRHFTLDRVSLIPDRRMGLPPGLREEALAETGIMMYGEEDWVGAARDTPVMPVWNDHGVGSPAATTNVEALLRAGFGYIGSLAQFQYGYPLWDDDVRQMTGCVEAVAMIAAKREDGVVLESYVEDGYCASFHDLATFLGWCMFHRYVAEDLIGAAHSQSFGSTFADPVRKQAHGLAMDAINTTRTPPSFTHGDTNSFGLEDDFDRNAVIVATDVMYTIARELKHPTGGSVHATPVSEASRIPTVAELIESLVIASEAERRARACPEIVDWAPIYAMRDRILAGGRRVFENILKGLAEIGVDTKDPLQLMLATRRLGAATIEELFNAGEPDPGYPRGFAPVEPTDTLVRLMGAKEKVLRGLGGEGALPDLGGVRVVAASSDVHEYGLFVLVEALEACGAEVTSLGTSVNSPEIAKVSVETAADAVAISTYNGMALSLGRQVREELHSRGVEPIVFLGGRLNEDTEEGEATDVRPMLREEGLNPCDSVAEMTDLLRRELTAKA
ncbi:MAG: cobalamin-dependent protein [Actinobacteria bacterium]|nr:cobalamin-dependent protein [Actinomycetota bacterium]